MRRMILLLVLGLVGCDLGTDDDDDRRWEATLEGTPGFEEVSGTAAVENEGSGATATIRVTNAGAGETRPWHVHEGTCATGGPIYADPADYPFLFPDADGDDARTAFIDSPLDPGDQYHVNVHVSPQDLPTIIACGDLVRVR